MMRLFTAIKVQPGIRFLELLSKLQQSLHYDRIKWVETGNIHITLRFFGETPEIELKKIIPALERSVTGHKPFEITLKDIGIFGSSYNPRVIWCGIEHSLPLQALAKSHFLELEKAAFPGDRQNFVPHLTLGRIKSIGNKNHFQDVIRSHQPGVIQQVPVKEIILFESILRREGPEYRVVERVEMG
ncbi:MAG: RNA 2',3'-cyclic phosphodiesterase [Bacteroidetes bacterium]|nr:RNA 2',3'-cyclic phosphodiesterase [Bacteroidota bacterium]